ncbi:MAG TPA: tryptophan synthase subunit alpha [Sandaracinaceae bacterium LLY-WYZ-13_1]|nr:tryptophan synthase subunit alpha [Sandaracinaceae bacterium LLY-WYZ-13_1]
MSRIAQAFARARADDRAALVIYLCAGDPSLALTPRLVEAAAEAGADVIEVGTPFSDPTADGPTIQRASERALAAGASLRGVLEAIREARRRTDVPIVLFGYYNPILRYGEARLARDAQAAGVDGLLVVDLPPESGASLLGPLREHGLDFVPLVAPTSPPARVEAAAEVAGSFLYYVSMTGVTGTAGADLEAAARRASTIADDLGRPVAVGFGVRTPDDVATVAASADGVVVGSAVVRAIHAADDDDAAVEAIRALVASLAEATRR